MRHTPLTCHRPLHPSQRPLGPAADVLDALHEAKAKAEKDGLYKKMQSGNPEDPFDAAEGPVNPLAAPRRGSARPRSSC